MDIGNRLRELRKAMQLSLGDISERSGLTRSLISRVELGRTSPSVRVLERWSDALGVPVAQLFPSVRARIVIGKGQKDMRLSKEERRFLALLRRLEGEDRQLWYSFGIRIIRARQVKR